MFFNMTYEKFNEFMTEFKRLEDTEDEIRTAFKKLDPDFSHFSIKSLRD